MDTTYTQQTPDTLAAAIPIGPTNHTIDIAALGIPVKFTSESDTAPTSVVSFSAALANQVREQVEKLAADRTNWEGGIYARSNEVLYGLIRDCYLLHRELTAAVPATRYKRMGFDDYITAKGLTFKASTPLTGKIIRCVFEGTDRRRLSTYHSVLRVAVAESWAPEEFSERIAAQGGVQAISLGKANGAMTAKQKAEMAKEQVLSQVLAKVSSDALAKLTRTDGIGSKAVAVMTQEADGSFIIRAVVHSDTAVNAALAAYFSTHKDEIKAMTNQAKANEQVASRDALIDVAAQAVVNG